MQLQLNDTIKEFDIDLTLLKEIPIAFARNNMILPIKKDDSNIYAAVADERGLFALLELSKHYRLKPMPLYTKASIIEETINKFYGQIGSALEVMDTIAGEDLTTIATEFEKPRDILGLTEEAPIIRLLNALFLQAVKDKASDIHIEPYEKELEVRFRIDGILQRVLTPPKIIQDALISRIKIMANLDIAEKRLPQDGRIRLLIGGKDIDIRVSLVPTTFGERAVLRLLDRSYGLIDLSQLGLNGKDAKSFEQLLQHTSGIILVTGPTGSGKTTTLYAVLNRIHTEEKNIITVEDPVEYQIKGIGQIQVNPKIGLTFATGLRSILRQDPDIIMVGEIRDFETAEIAIQASLTGHLVLSTLHTNDAPSAITRLLDMGVEPFLVASSLIAVLAQRLVRTLCNSCKEPYEPDVYEQTYLKSSVNKLFRSKGCDKCRQTGYVGRTGIFELLLIDNQIRQMITSRQDSVVIKNYAISKGMKTLYEDGIEKIIKGYTTLQEVLRVIQKDYADI
ncbi:MAG: type II secretion system ATPase GspE [Thermodesulfovibrionales bacterium]|nr:type II secretion system ATPase GspE [Thermodesulfovibrionales bacterium]